jgi:trigger factor
VRRGKALAHVLETAKITDASGNPVDLEALQRETRAMVEPPAAEAEAAEAATPAEGATPTEEATPAEEAQGDDEAARL